MTQDLGAPVTIGLDLRADVIVRTNESRQLVTCHIYEVILEISGRLQDRLETSPGCYDKWVYI